MKPSDTPGFALISTLLIIAILTIMVVAFMQSMRIDRITARSYLNRQQAEMAANAGVNQAQVSLRQMISANSYFSMGYTNYQNQISPVFMGALNANTAPTMQYLMSMTNTAMNPAFNASNSVNLNKMSRTGGWIGSPMVNGVLVATTNNAQWVNILKDPTKAMQPNRASANYNPVVARYAYWIDDETTKIDFSLAGNADGPSGAFLRSTNSFEIKNMDIGALPLSGKAPLTGTPGNVINKSLVDARAAANIRKTFDSGQISFYANPLNADGNPDNDVNVLDDIRFHTTAYSLSNELSGMGRRRVNLNSIVTNVAPGDAGATQKVAADLDDIIFAIAGKHPFGGLNNTTHSAIFQDKTAPDPLAYLPNFGKRFYTTPSVTTTGTFKQNHEMTYLLRIAANIRDYIDTDSMPTYISSANNVVFGSGISTAWRNGEEPVVLGKESSPNLQEHAWHLIVTEYTPLPNAGSISNRVRISFSLDHYVELYNSSTKDWTAPTGSTLRIYSMPDIDAGTASPAIELPDLNLNISGITFPAGQAIVITTCPNQSDDPTAMIQNTGNVRRVTVPTSSRLFSTVGNESVSGRYGLQFAQRTSTNTDYLTELVINTPNAVIDSHPYIAITASYTMTRASDVNNKAVLTMSSNMQGNSAVSRTGDPRSVNEQLQNNGGSNGAYGSDQARFFTSITPTTQTPPNTSTWGLPENPSFVFPNLWPDWTANRSNSANSAYGVIADGPMTSIGELGNIYDPHRKLDVASPVGILSARGGGRSLKIGQADDLIGPRYGALSTSWVGWFNAAWRLTDIFSVGPAAEVLAPSTAEGKLNINGVMRDQGVALKSLLRSFQYLPNPNSDAGKAGQTLSDTEINNLITSLKAYLTTNGPMMERGELSQLSYFTGNMNDRAREEIFRRIIEMITTRSASFTVYCIGESVLQKPDGTITRVAASRQKVSFTLKPVIGNNPFDTVTGYTLENYATSSE